MTTLARLTTWFNTDAPRPGTAAPPAFPALSQRMTALARGHPLAADAVLAAAVAGQSAGALPGGSGRTAALAVFVTGLALPLIWRRRHPAAVFAVVCAVALAQWLYDQRVLSSFAILLALYSVARHAPRRVTLAAAVTAEAAGALAAPANGRNWLQFLAVLTAVIAAPAFLGSYLRARQACPPALAVLSQPPGLDQLDALLGQVRAAGLTAELAVTGRRFPVPADAQLAVCRIVQEATANTIRHSRGATGVRVRLEYADPVIEIDITDDGLPGTGTSHRYPAGHGLAGMRELAALYGGALIAGPRPGGGWRVSAGLSPAAQAQPPPAPRAPASRSPTTSPSSGPGSACR